MTEDRKLLIFAMPGRLGDLIAVEPAFRHLAKLHPNRRKVLYTKPAFAGVYRMAPFLDDIVEVKTSEEYLQLKNSFPEDALLYEFNVKSSSQARTFREQFPLLSGLTGNCCPEVIGETPRCYRDPGAVLPELPPKYAVFHSVSGGRRRQWPQSRWNALARCCMRAGWSVVEIGEHQILSEAQVVHCNGLLDFQIAAGIMAQAGMFVGIESGFAHLANSLGIFGIVIAGKLQKYADYNPYTGFYSPDGNGCNMVRYFDEYPLELPETVAEWCLQKALDGSPMSYCECQLYCREMQIRALQQAPLRRIERALTAPIRTLKIRRLAHQNKHA